MLMAFLFSNTRKWLKLLIPHVWFPLHNLTFNIGESPKNVTFNEVRDALAQGTTSLQALKTEW